MTNASTGRSEVSVKSVGITLDVLEAVASARQDMGITELANQLGLTKATVFRHLKSLLDRGYVSKTSTTSRYRLGIKSYLLGQMASASIDLLSAADSTMQELREKTGETVVLTAVEANAVRVVATLQGKSQFEIGVRTGSELLLHASAQGKVALAFHRRFAARRQKGSLPALTEHTISTWAHLQRELELIRRQGWATAPEQVVLGLNAVAAPIFDEGGDCIAAVAVVGSIQFIRRQPVPRQVAAVRKAAAEISRNLGYGTRPRDRQTTAA